MKMSYQITLHKLANRDKWSNSFVSTWVFSYILLVECNTVGKPLFISYVVTTLLYLMLDL